MASPEMTLAVYFSVIAAVSLIYNFITIHPLANLVIFDGVDKSKSLSISTEFALLTSTFYILGIALAMAAGVDVSLNITTTFGVLLYSVVGGSALLVEIIRIWYIRKVFETNYLYTFIIAEAANIALVMLITVLSYTVFALL